MFFFVTDNGEQGVVAVTCETAAAAAKKARALTAEGVRDVLITDADGLQHAPTDFVRLFVATARRRPPSREIATGNSTQKERPREGTFLARAPSGGGDQRVTRSS